MQFTPKSRETLAESGLIPKGLYDFLVIGADDATSKAGNPMLVVSLKLWMEDGGVRFLTDWIVPTSDMGLAKLLSFCDAADLYEQYEHGNLEADMCQGKAGKVYITQKKDKNTGEVRNNVREYQRAGDAPKTGAVAPADAEDSPFN